nr:hypothetical protein [Mycoplasmopsis bovis]
MPKAGFSSFEWIISFWALIESSIFLSAELNSNSLEWFNFRYSLTSKL